MGKVAATDAVKQKNNVQNQQSKNKPRGNRSGGKSNVNRLAFSQKWLEGLKFHLINIIKY